MSVVQRKHNLIIHIVCHFTTMVSLNLYCLSELAFFFFHCCYSLLFLRLKKDREAPPSTNPDDEPLPRRLQEINRLRQLVKDGKFVEKKKQRKKKKKKVETENVFDHAPISTAAFLGPDDVMTRGMKRPEKQVPTIQQRPGESDKAFLHRANMLCDVSSARLFLSLFFLLGILINNTFFFFLCIATHQRDKI